MTTISRDDLLVARVLSEDDDFITLEVGKHDGVSWRVAPLTEDDDSSPQQFYTLIFLSQKHGVWKPWEDDSGVSGGGEH